MQSGSMLENIIFEIDSVLRTIAPPKPRITQRPVPGLELPENILSSTEKKKIAALMRVNHSGEVCAQALYRGQALTAKQSSVKEKLLHSAQEETDHLAWCEYRLTSLNSQPSLFNPIWYAGSFFIGSLAGMLGDKVSLGFLAETENQVSEHLNKHMGLLPEKDLKSLAILKQMDEDERQHAAVALEGGGIALPSLFQTLMRQTAKIMTSLSYYI